MDADAEVDVTFSPPVVLTGVEEFQQIKPPKCFCGQLSRLKKVKKSIAGGEESRAVGNYFFFCNKAKGDESKCRFARPVQDVKK